MDREYKKSQSPSSVKIAVLILAVVDVFLAAILIVCLIINPVKGSSVKADLPEDFVENDEDYPNEDNRAEYSSSVEFVYDSTGALASGTQEDADGAYAGFVFPDSNTRLITDSDIQSRVTGPEVCRRAINEIYARHGYAFSKQENIDYFNQYDWYKNMSKETDMNRVSSQFSETERQNVEKLKAYEKSNGWN